MSLLSLVSLICLSPFDVSCSIPYFFWDVHLNYLLVHPTHLLSTRLCRQHLYSALKIKCWRKRTSPCPLELLVWWVRRFLCNNHRKSWVVKQRMFPENGNWAFQSEWGGMGLLGKMTGKLRPRGQIRSGRWGHRESNGGRAFQRDICRHLRMKTPEKSHGHGTSSGTSSRTSTRKSLSLTMLCILF